MRKGGLFGTPIVAARRLGRLSVAANAPTLAGDKIGELGQKLCAVVSSSAGN